MVTLNTAAFTQQKAKANAKHQSQVSALCPGVYPNLKLESRRGVITLHMQHRHQKWHPGAGPRYLEMTSLSYMSRYDEAVTAPIDDVFFPNLH
jgi:hypothetical protein